MNQQGREIVSVLVADLASSTLVRSELGQDRADALETALMTSMHEIVTNNGGSIVRSTGDGLVSTFPAATACLDASVSLQQAVDRVVRTGDIDELSLRVGVAAGDVMGGEFGPIGIPMAQAARLEQHARPGSILCIEEVEHLLGTSSHHVLDPIGALDLKGLPQPVQVAEVRWSALPSARPMRTELGGFETSLPLAGRETHLDRLVDLVEHSVRTRSTSTALVHGESGVGKTRLLYELSRRPDMGHASVLYAPCRVKPHQAFGPIRDLLQHVVDHADPELLRHWAARDSALGVVLPTLARRIKEIGAPLRASGEETRSRSIAALSRFLGEVLRDQPLVLLLDDVQWIDNSSVEVLEAILEREDVALAVICGSRVDASDLDERLVRALHRRPESHLSLALHPLARHHVVDIVDQVLPSADQSLAERVWQKSSGSPFAVSTLVGTLGSAERPDIEAAVPSFVDALESIGTGPRRFVEAAVVLGPDADPWLAGEAAELGEDDMISAAEAAEKAGLMTVTMAEGTLSLAFRHDLVVAEIRQRINVDEHLELHSRAAQLLSDRSVELDASALARIATHLERAGPLVAPDECAKAYLRAAEATFAIGEFREVIHLTECGLAVAPSGDSLLRAELLLIRARSHGLLLDTPEAIAAGIEVAAIAERLGCNRLLAQAATVQVRQARGDGREAEWNEVFQRAISSFDETVDAALRSRVLSNSLWSFLRGDALDASTREAVRLADADGNVETQIGALYQRLLASIGSPFLDEQWALLERLRELWEPFDWGCSYAGILLVQSAHALARGDRSAFDSVLEEARRHIERAPVLWDRSWYERLETVQTLIDGRWQDADRQLGEPLRSVPSEFEVTLTQVAWSAVEQGHADLAEGALGAAGPVSQNPYFRAGRAMILADLGRTDEAIEIARQVTPFVIENHRVGVHTAAGVLAQLTRVIDAVQDVEVAESLLPMIEPWEGQMFWAVDVLAFGAADRFLGILASCLGDESRSRQLFKSALVMEERFGAPPFVARTSFAFARNLQRWGDLDGARFHSDNAAKIAEELGMSQLVVDCTELL